MVAEQNILDMHSILQEIELDDDRHKRKIDELETKVKNSRT